MPTYFRHVRVKHPRRVFILSAATPVTSARVTQDTLEVVVTPTPFARVTQDVLEVLAQSPTSARVTQDILEVLINVGVVPPTPTPIPTDASVGGPEEMVIASYTKWSKRRKRIITFRIPNM